VQRYALFYYPPNLSPTFFKKNAFSAKTGRKTGGNGAKNGENAAEEGGRQEGPRQRRGIGGQEDTTYNKVRARGKEWMKTQEGMPIVSAYPPAVD
jgi:hypothetical protein